MIWSGDKYKIWGDGVIHELPTKLLTTPIQHPFTDQTKSVNSCQNGII